MAMMKLASGWYGLEPGTLWRDATGTVRVVVVSVRRSGVIGYRRVGAPPDDERVTNVVHFVETFAPAESGFDGPTYDDLAGGASSGRQA